MKKNLFIALTAGLSLVAASAFAECNETQEAEAGMYAATVSKDAVSKVVPVTGKQMVNVASCEFRAGQYIVDYKYNFLGADGLYWVEASAKFGAGGSSPSIKFTKKSPNLEAAEAKAGTKLASN
jgi:hypothetical protein